MRLLKVRIKRGDHTKGESQMVYPARYNAQEVDRVGRYSTTINMAGVSLSGDIGRGDPEEFCIIALPDELAEEYAQDPDMAIIDSSTADALMEAWRARNQTPVETVRDVTRIQVIQAKQAAGVPLSQEDLEALDPESPTKGINKSRRGVKEALGSVNDDLEVVPEESKTIRGDDPAEDKGVSVRGIK